MLLAKRLSKDKYELKCLTEEGLEVYTLSNIDGVALYDFLRGRLNEELNWALDIAKYSTFPVTIDDNGEIQTNGVLQ